MAEPVLTAAGRFEFSPAALDLVFRYRMQSFADQLDGRADPAAPAQGCRRHVVLPAAVLADLAGGSLAAGELRARAVVGEEILEEDPETVR
ncbi:MAG: hypothetical protein D6760_05640 [Deltaproteobacteria bacterium]|nr:MAG: hypothetical protein D6760_05640 [Deltaproteobacteria bacterium]